MSKEELIKLVKRQLLLTHKAKSRSEGDMRLLCAVMSCHIVIELTKEVAELRKQVAERPQGSHPVRQRLKQ